MAEVIGDWRMLFNEEFVIYIAHLSSVREVKSRWL